MFENDHLHVLELSGNDEPFAEDLPEGAVVLCLRSGPVPASGDWKVLAAGHVLYLTEDVNDGRTGVLQISDGQFRYRLLEGELSGEESAQVVDRLAQYEERFGD